jgi:hypothetical protein
MKVAVCCPCGQGFEAEQRVIDRGRGRYCSRACMYAYRVRPKGLKYKIKAQNRGWYRPGHGPTGGESKPGERRSPATEFKPGQRRSTQTEFKPGQVPWNRDTRGVMPSDSDHHAWLGDNAGYATLHDWGEDKPLDLSNISGEYRRDVSDWRHLCRSCHFRYDRENIPGASIARFPERKK